MIISSGVNIYPQKIENVLFSHSMVCDVAEFGIPNDNYGQEANTIVLPVDGHRLNASAEALASLDEKQGAR